MSAKIDDATKFAEWLFDQTPRYDELILADMDKPRLNALPQDVRLLPNPLRRVYCARCPERRAAKRLRMKLWKFRSERERASILLEQRLKKWIKALPKNRRIKERKLRWFRPSQGWIGHVVTGVYPQSNALERFKRIFPNVTQQWQNEP